MRRYEGYKDSGVEWLGEVPSHWEVENSKRVFSYRKDKAEKTDEQLTSSQKYGVIPQNLFMDLEGRRVTVVEFNYEILKHVEKGDFVISMRSFQGGIEYCNYTGCVSSAYVALIPTSKVHSQYYRFLLKSGRYIEALQSTSNLVRDGQALRYENFCMVPLIVPPLSEQQKIAQFLDDKTAKIDQAVDLAEKQIALLKEHKQILIQNAVTRGLNPDVPLKDSGVEWIGQVPEHWEVKRFRNLFDFGKGLSITKENLQDEGIPCVNYGEIHSKYGFEVIPERDALKCVDSKYLVFKNSMLNKGDFVFADTSEDIEGSGNFTYLNSSTRIFAGYHTVITRLKITAIHRYIAYYFDSLSFRNQIRNKVKGVKVFSITQSILKGTFMLLPNLKEQQQIANYLDKQTAKIDQAIALKTAHIEKLKEYKNVLINDVVTGKVRV